MGRHWVALGLLGALLAGRAEAQHAAASIGVDDPGCSLCHGSHPGRGEYMLSTGSLGPAVSARVGAVSQSCLRCHLTPSIRSSQPEFVRGGIIGFSQGRFVGADLSRGHPLGRQDTPGGIFATRDPRRPAGITGVAGRSVSGERGAVECVTCHDPHRRSTALQTALEERATCSRCHDPASYTRSGHSSVACSGCHDLHGGAMAGPALVRNRDQSVFCGVCHDPGRAQLNAPVAGRGAGGAAPLAPPGHDRTANNPGGADCTSCHRPHR